MKELVIAMANNATGGLLAVLAMLLLDVTPGELLLPYVALVTIMMVLVIGYWRRG